MKTRAPRKRSSRADKPISKPRGGLAADHAAIEAEKKKTAATDGKANGNGEPESKRTEVGNSRGKLGQLFGNSAVRVIIAAGRAGATFEKVEEVLKANGIKAKASTIKQNLRLGKKKKLDGAELTKEQLAQFGV